jgi:hypothetical protein
LLDTQIGASEIHLYESQEHRRNFIDCVKTREETICPIGTAVRVDTISHLCDISTRMGRPIKWDPDSEKILGDPDAEKMLTRPMRSPWTV